MSWEQLQAIYQETQATIQQSGVAPTACPIDGERLEINQRGERNCPLGNYRYP